MKVQRALMRTELFTLRYHITFVRGEFSVLIWHIACVRSDFSLAHRHIFSVRGLAVREKGCIFAKNFDDDGQRFFSAVGRGGARGAVRRRQGVQDAVQGAARVRRADGAAAVCAAGDGAGGHGGGAGRRVAAVARRGRGGWRGGVLQGPRGAARGLGRAGEGAVGRVVPGVHDPLRAAAGGRPAALHADAGGGGGEAERLRQ